MASTVVANSSDRYPAPNIKATGNVMESEKMQSQEEEMYRGFKLSDVDKFTWIQNTGKDKFGKRTIKCKICSNAALLPKLISKSNRMPPIADSQGCRFNSKVVIDHELSSIHHAAIEATTDKQLFREGSTEHPWLAVCRKMDKKLFNKLVVFCFDIFNDAKTGTISAWSWPSRHLARSASSAFLSSDAKTSEFCPQFEDIMYLNPHTHRELTNCIADVGRVVLVADLQRALAISLSYDGSVDAYQEDSKYVGIRYVTPDGELRVKFLGSEEPTARGVTGAVGAIKAVINKSTWNFDEASKVICGLTTDGESLNTGCKNGLWAKLQEECVLRVMCVWCACHRSSLAFKSLFKMVDEANKVLLGCRAVSAYFRASGIRSLELSKIADALKIQMLHFPEFKEVRMTEFTGNLFKVMIRNLQACLQYWTDRIADKSETEADRSQMRGFLNTWTNVDRLTLLHLLLDCCDVMQCLQKRLQATFLALDDVGIVKTWAMARLRAMLSSPAIGGYEQKFLSALVSSDSGDVTWNGFTLCKSSRRTERAHLFTSVSGRNYDAVRQEVIMSMTNFIDDRLDDSDLTTLAASLFTTKSWTEDIQDDDFVEKFGVERMIQFHAKFVPDLELIDLISDFTLLKSSLKSDKPVFQMLLSQTCLRVESTDEVKQPEFSLLKYALRINARTYAVACARVVSVFPHSMYVERLVSAHNLIKSEMRASMDRSTVNDYLIIKESMGSVAKFDPRPAIANWMTRCARCPKQNSGSKIDSYKKNEFIKKFFE